jgi:large subunit ribosomal protein L25
MASASASSRPVFKVAERSEFGSRTTRRLRRTGQVPGVVYTGGEDARPFQADAREISRFLSEGHTLFDLEIEGADAVPVVVKEQQRHPVRGELIHIDLHQVDLTVAIQADVTIELEGAEDAPGVKDGGVLEHVAREITVEGLPADIPENITVDVSEMVIGDTLQLSSITAPEGVEFVADSPEEFTIATLNPPPVIEEPETEVEEETEVIGEGEEAQA